MEIFKGKYYLKNKPPSKLVYNNTVTTRHQVDFKKCVTGKVVINIEDLSGAMYAVWYTSDESKGEKYSFATLYKESL